MASADDEAAAHALGRLAAVRARMGAQAELDAFVAAESLLEALDGLLRAAVVDAARRAAAVRALEHLREHASPQDTDPWWPYWCARTWHRLALCWSRRDDRTPRCSCRAGAGACPHEQDPQTARDILFRHAERWLPALLSHCVPR